MSVIRSSIELLSRVSDRATVKLTSTSLLLIVMLASEVNTPSVGALLPATMSPSCEVTPSTKPHSVLAELPAGILMMESEVPRVDRVMLFPKEPDASAFLLATTSSSTPASARAALMESTRSSMTSLSIVLSAVTVISTGT